MSSTTLPKRVNLTFKSTDFGSIGWPALVSQTRNSGGTPVSKIDNSKAKSPSRNIRPRCGPFSGSACSAAGADDAITGRLTKPKLRFINIAKLIDERILLFFIICLTEIGMYRSGVEFQYAVNAGFQTLQATGFAH